VARIGEEVFAVADICTHSEASLSEGDISNYKIECWLHGAEFDLRTGEALTPPAVEKLETFEVRRDGDTVTISEK
jgi:3-phenylpropionate/trans-cinnamate dioxygenase ferredoxin subunit